ncbi:MAG: autotransporter domain-containing protein [Planctomycetaceae bacterium]|jgi:hypothetical protein|nr:autotransporter domain-containing protein [Planctomycetaceae bacterium]
MKPKFKKYFNQLQIIITIAFTALLAVTIDRLLETAGELFAADSIPLYNSPVPTSPQQNSGYTVFRIDDHDELNTILSNNTILNQWIKLEDNVFIPGTIQFFLADNSDLVIELGMYNLQTDSNFYFDAAQPSKVTILGSTMIANGGLQLHGETTLNYYGTYGSGRADILASTTRDNVTFNLTGINSRWDAANTIPKFINSLPMSNTGYESGTIIVGEGGTANVNITSGNDGESGEIIIGARYTAKGTCNLSGIYETENVYNPTEKLIKKATTWNNTGTLYIGYLGEGTANINSGAILKTGSIGIGIDSDSGNTGKGKLNVEGIGEFIDKTKSQNFIISKGKPNYFRGIDYIVESEYFNTDTTHIYIYGRDDEVKQSNDLHVGFLNPAAGGDTLKSIGDGIMTITKGAVIEFDESKTVSGEPSNYTPKITVGKGDSIVDNSIIIGRRDAAKGDVDNGGKNDTDNFDDVGLIDGTDLAGALQANSLTFQNNAVLQGNLKIRIGENVFKSGSILTPGFGSYHLYLPSKELIDHENFGRIEFKNNSFKHESDAVTIIDFDIHGDQNYGLDPSKQTAYSKGGDNFGYADNGYYRGRDLIMIYGNAKLAGDVYFRPQTGYYSDNVKIDFMRVTGVIDDQYDRLHLYPYRWFKEPALVSVNQMNMFIADRNMSPFTDIAVSRNQVGVGGALDNIYNRQNNDKWLPVLDWFWLMDDDQLRTAVQLLGGEVKASSFYMPLRSAWRFGFDRINWSENGRKVYFGPQNIHCPQVRKSVFWATSFFDYQSIDSDRNAAAMSTQRVSMMAGYDRALSAFCNIGVISDVAAGVIFSYSQPKLDQLGCRVVADDYLVGFHSAARVYSAYELKSWLGIGTQRYRLSRSIPITGQNPALSSVYRGNSVSGSIQAARPVRWYGVLFRPHIALDMNFIKQNSGIEKYDGEVMRQAALKYHVSDWFQVFSRAGIRADYGRSCFGHSCNLAISLGYSYLLGGDQAPESEHEFIYAGGGKFKMTGNNLSRSFANVDLGGQLYLNRDKNKMIYIMYNSSYSKYMNAHTMSIGYQFLF